MFGVDVACFNPEDVGEHLLGGMVAPHEDVRHDLQDGIPGVAQDVKLWDLNLRGDALELVQDLVQAIESRVLELKYFLLDQNLEGLVGDNQTLAEATDVAH